MIHFYLVFYRVPEATQFKHIVSINKMITECK
jgi:hypothetical protein